jgi:hypothetical protein
VTVVTPYAAEPPQQQQAPVVVNQITPAQPEIREYGTRSEPRSEVSNSTQLSSGPTIYLIAFRNHSIRPALAYWTKGDSLYYLSLDHRQRTVPLSTVDRDFSLQLNHERHVPFRLP